MRPAPTPRFARRQPRLYERPPPLPPCAKSHCPVCPWQGWRDNAVHILPGVVRCPQCGTGVVDDPPPFLEGLP